METCCVWNLVKQWQWSCFKVPPTAHRIICRRKEMHLISLFCFDLTPNMVPSHTMQIFHPLIPFFSPRTPSSLCQPLNGHLHDSCLGPALFVKVHVTCQIMWLFVFSVIHPSSRDPEIDLNNILWRMSQFFCCFLLKRGCTSAPSAHVSSGNDWDARERSWGCGKHVYIAGKHHNVICTIRSYICCPLLL